MLKDIVTVDWKTNLRTLERTCDISLNLTNRVVASNIALEEIPKEFIEEQALDNLRRFLISEFGFDEIIWDLFNFNMAFQQQKVLGANLRDFDTFKGVPLEEFFENIIDRLRGF